MVFAGWEKYVQRVTKRLAQDLGVPSNTKVASELYKLLLYRPGDHFRPHRDTEKSPGMFSTMSLILPSNYQVCFILPNAVKCSPILLTISPES